MKYIVIPVAKVVSCLCIAQIMAVAYVFILVWSLNPASALRETKTLWGARYTPEGFFLFAAYVMALCSIFGTFKKFL